MKNSQIDYQDNRNR